MNTARLALAVFASAGMALAGSLSIAGSTTGSFQNSPSILSFTGTSFGPIVLPGPGSGATGSFNIGDFTVGDCTNLACVTTPSSSFELQVTFSLPTGISGGQTNTFTADVDGFVVYSDALGNFAVDFTNPSQTFTFDDGTTSGILKFNIEEDRDHDVDLNNGSWTNEGTLRHPDWVFTPGTTDLNADVCAIWTSDPVPEPASILLLGTLFAGLGLTLRRKRS